MRAADGLAVIFVGNTRQWLIVIGHGQDLTQSC